MENTPKMRKQINLKAILILTVATAVVCVTAYFVHAFQVQRTATGLREQAELFKKDKKVDLAIKSLEQYLGLMPEDNESLVKLGTWLEEAAKTPLEKYRAFLVLKQALRRDEQLLDTQRKVAGLAVELGLFADAKTHLKYLKDHKIQDAGTCKLTAQAEAGLRNFEEAKKNYLQAIQLDPGQFDLYAQYAYLLRVGLNQPKEADSQISKMVEVAKEESQARQARLAAARYFRTFELWDKANIEIQAALQLKADEAEAFLLAGEIAQAQGEMAQANGEEEKGKRSMDEARKHFASGLKTYPENIELILALGKLDLQQGNKDQAATSLQTALKDLPRRPDQLFTLGNLLLDAERLDQVRIVIIRLKAQQLAPFADYLQARLEVREEKFNEAAVLLEKARFHKIVGLEYGQRVQLGQRIEAMLGDCYGALGNPDRQVEAYQQALQKAPYWLKVQQRLASTWVTLGKLDEAIKQYGKIAAQDPNQNLELARLLIEWNRTIPQTKQDWGKVESLLKSLEKQHPTTGKVAMLRATMLAARGNLEQARVIAVSVRDQNPKDIAPWLFLLALSEIQQAKDQELQKMVDDAEANTGPKVDWHLIRAKYLLKSDTAEAKKYVQKLEGDLSKFSKVEQDRLLFELGLVYRQLKDNGQAKKLWNELAQRQPKNLNIRFRLLELAFFAEEKEELEQWVKELRGLEGNGPFTTYGEAAQLILLSRGTDRNQLGKAQEKLDQAADFRPNWSKVPWLKAIAYDLENKKEDALESYKTALARGEKQLGVYKRTLELMRELGLYADAKSLLEELPSVVKNSEDFYRVSVEVNLLGSSQGDAQQKALAVAEKATANSKDYKDYLWLGQVAVTAKSPLKAEKAFRQAKEMAEKQAKEGKLKAEELSGPYLVYLLYILERDQKQGKIEMELAEKNLSTEQKPIVLAPCHESLGDLKKAEEYYQLAFTNSPQEAGSLRNLASFYVRHNALTKAEPLLRKLIPSDTKVPEATQKWARRTLALVLSKRPGDYVKFKEALDLIDQNRDKGKLSLADEQTRALVLAEHPAHRNEAIQELEKLSLGKTALPSNLGLRLAQLYYANGKLDDAEAYIKSLPKATPKNPAFLALQVRISLKKGNLFRASQEVNELAKISPKVLETVELQAKVLHANKKVEQAKELLVKYASEQKDVPRSMVAKVLGELGYYSEAEKMIQQHIADSKDPNSPLQLAQLLAIQGKLDAAFDICEKTKEKGSATAIGITYSDIIQQGKTTPAQQQKVISWLEKAMKDNPKEELLPVMLANLYGNRGDMDQAIPLYQQALARNEKQVLIANNLAYMLAFKPGKQAEARECIEKAIKFGGSIGELLDTRAVVLLQSNQPQDAIRDLQDALRQTQSGIRYFHLAKAYLMDGNKIRAEEEFDRSVKEFGLTMQELPRPEQPWFTELNKLKKKTK